MDLLTNAIESIQAGVEDFETATRPRLLSAVRNIHAGVLLLYKEALLRRSPANSNEALLKARTRLVATTNGDLTVIGVGTKTVDVQQILERFEDLGITTDAKLLSEITRVRNEIEHYFPKVAQESVRSTVASAFLIIRDFVKRELGAEPRDLLGQGTWDTMLKVSQLYQVERVECNARLEEVEWESGVLADGVRRVRCEACGSDLLQPDDSSQPYADIVLTCRVCGESLTAEQFVPTAIEEGLEWEAYVATKDGDEAPYGECPTCGLDTYVLAESRCALCGEDATTECSRCGTNIPLNEMESAPLCGYCDHMMSKND